MATPHISANVGDFAESILLPGDPLRAKYIADTFLTDVVQVNDVRNMLGYTGFYKGKKVSVMGTGMGIPSISIYAKELITEYGVKNLIRVGTAGAISLDVKIRDVILRWVRVLTQALTVVVFKGTTLPRSPIMSYWLTLLLRLKPKASVLRSAMFIPQIYFIHLMKRCLIPVKR